MEELNPTLWRTCRVLSNESRLQMLMSLFEKGAVSVGQLARNSGISESSASMHLRALNSRGLISAERRKLFVFYSPVPNPAVRYAPELVDALRYCRNHADGIHWIMKQTTAFTHYRRIDIAIALSNEPMEHGQLAREARISPVALYRHIRKLMDRGYVSEEKGLYRLQSQSHPLGATLVAAATS